jgi:hypothetical protein
MAYCIKGPLSDVCMYRHFDNYIKCECCLLLEPGASKRLDNPGQALCHLEDHRLAGHMVPPRVVGVLEGEDTGYREI